MALSVLTLEEAAEYLRIDPKELLAELEQSHLPGAVKIAGKWRIKREALESLFDSSQLRDQTTLNSPPDKANKEILDRREEVNTQSTSTVDKLSSLDFFSGSSSVSQSNKIAETSPAYSVIDASVASLPPPSSDQKNTTPTLIKPDVKKPDQPNLWPDPYSEVIVRAQGEIFSYNHKQRFGYVRLANGRVVWFDTQQFLDRNYVPKLGDRIEFEIRQTRKGVQAYDIRLVSKEGHSATEVSISSQSKAGVSSSSIPPSKSPVIPLPRPKQSPPRKGTDKSQALYKNAAVARAEGRINDARFLFRQALEAGAGTQVYEAFFKLLVEKGFQEEARQVIEQAIDMFPDHTNYYEMYGQMERKSRRYDHAEEIFRKGLKLVPSHVSLQTGLAQTLFQIGTKESLKEAEEIFQSLDKKGKLNRADGLYQRFRALQRNPRADKAYEFFQACKMRPGITGLSNLPKDVTDIVIDIGRAEFDESFGLSGAFLVRCFGYSPSSVELVKLQEYLRNFGPRDILGVQDGRGFIINTSLAFIVVANSNAVRDQVMNILSESGEAIVPLDDTLLEEIDNPLQILRDVLAQYLGLRDLYSSTMPVSGRRFFGREKLLLTLTDQIHGGQFLGIYGLRKMGKTSLLYQLRDEKLRKEAVAYVDLQASASLTLKNCNPLYWELERDLYQRLYKQYPDVANLLRLGKIERFSELPEGGQHAGLLFGEDLRALLDVIQEGKTASVKRLVIVLDELERILPVAEQAGIEGYLQFFGLLRGLAQTDRYRNLLTSIIVAANATISERGYWEGIENPVFALYKSIFLPPFTWEECNEMIVTLGKGMSVKWNSEALETIFTETGGHPFLTRVFCSRIVKQYPARPLTVTVEMVIDQIMPFIRDEGDKFEQITELLRINFPQEEKFLEQIALDEAPPDLPDEALRHLLGYQLIRLEGHCYQITLNLLRRWLRRRVGIKD